MTLKTLNLTDLDFHYPEHLVATERALFSRILYNDVALGPIEINRDEFLGFLKAGDVWVVNETKVLRRRVFTNEGLEVLFIRPLDANRTEWEVLCPSSRWLEGTRQTILIDSGGLAGKRHISLEILKRGRPQIIFASEPLTENLFDEMGELPLPPYIQKARNQRHVRSSDETQYQSIWAKHGGSLAAPTASFHFDQDFVTALQAKGVEIAKLTLHVGLGTFLPVTVEKVADHKMHSEDVFIPNGTIEAVARAKSNGSRVIAVGTTVARALESMGQGYFQETAEGGLAGPTSLMIQPGHQWNYVDVLATNFHQPKSTLLALVASFSSLETVLAAYRWAISREFRLFSYGDLTVWSKDSLMAGSSASHR
jgi:S-adenosylmethionine:tRNA ribosyltransferase-isomerase